jgi:hypothetical protein
VYGSVHVSCGLGSKLVRCLSWPNFMDFISWVGHSTDDVSQLHCKLQPGTKQSPITPTMLSPKHAEVDQAAEVPGAGHQGSLTTMFMIVIQQF